MATQSDFVWAALGATETTETSLGTITIPTAGIKRITGIYGTAMAVTTTAENVSGWFRLAFKTIPGVFRFPAQAINAPSGTIATGATTTPTNIIPVNIQVPANETVQAFMGLNALTTGAVTGMVGLIFEGE